MAQSVRRGLVVALAAVGRVLGLLFGRVAWQAPPWLRAFGRGLGQSARWVRAHRARAAAGAGALALVAVAVVGVGRWYAARPKPVLTDVMVEAPPPTPIAEVPKPRPLFVDFDGSAAPLDRVGKTVTTGVRLAPRLEGTWTWVSDQRLSFVPMKDWPIGQEITVTLAPRGLVAPHVRLTKYELSFTTAPFEVRLGEAEFHQDPIDPDLKKVVATFAFSHPVDPASFEGRLAMRLLPSDKEDAESDVRFQVSYDKLRARAFVHSAPLAMPRKDAALRLRLREGARAARGGRPFGAGLEEKVRVPGLYNFLRVTAARLLIVDNERQEPEQILLVETSAAVTDEEARRAVSATLLPATTAKGERARYGDVQTIDAGDVARGAAVKLAPLPGEKDHATSHSFKLVAPAGRQLLVRVQKGMRAFGGYVLAETQQNLLQVPAHPRRLKLLHSGALLALGGERKLSVFLRDVPAVKVEIARVLPGQLHHLVSQSSGTFADPQWGHQFDQENLAQISSEIVPVALAEPGKPHYEAIDLGRHMSGAGGERRGVFLVTVASWDVQAQQPLGEQDRRLVLVSDLGILAKQSADGSCDVFVQSIRTGQPVPGARVQVIGKNGVGVVSQTSDAAGHVRFETLDFPRERSPALFLATLGADQAFLPFGRSDRLLDISRFDVGGVSEEGAAKDALVAYLFSDRGLYRPGDEIRVGVVVKSRDFSAALEGVPLEATITDPRGLVVKTLRLRLGAAGFEELRHRPPEIAPTGGYTIDVHLVKNDRREALLGSTTVSVREFLPDRMKIKVGLSREAPDGWVHPSALEGRVALANLFGTPAADRRVRVQLSLSPWVPHLPKLRGYRFFDPLRARDGSPPEPVTEELPEARTDADGLATVPLPLQRFAPAIYRLTLTAEGLEAEGGRGVTGEVSAIVSPLPHLIGYKADGDLTYVNRGAARAVELVAIDPQGRRTKAGGLEGVLLERRYVSVLARQDNGTFRYQSVRKEVERSRKAFELPAAGRKLPLATDAAGDFVFVLRNDEGQDLQRIEYTVAGFGNLSREVEKNAELALALRARDVEPGGTLELQIKAPFTGAGLITIERDRVYAWKWFKADTTATVEQIALPEGLEGGGYVSVSFIRDPASPEIFMSPMSHGVVPFTVSRARREVKLSVEATERLKPGEPLRLRYSADRPARVVLIAVDEGILRVARHKTPDPLGFFFEKRALGVRTSQILDMILPEYERLLSTLAPGGDGEGALGARLNPFRRKQEAPVAFWSGLLEAGPQAKETHFDVPDSFNGTLRVMAVAVAPDALAAWEGKTLVRGDFVIAPNAPTFLAPGDETEVSVGVTNAVVGSGKAAAVELALAPSASLEPLDGIKRSLAIDELGEGVARFRVRARAPLGSATLAFTATRGDKRARLQTTLSVRPAAPFMTSYTAGRLREGEVTVPVRRKMHAEFRTLEAGLSHLPLGLAHALTGYLEGFPHGCTEQVTSQLVPAVVLGKRPEFGLPRDKVQAAFDRGITALRARQNGDGSFGRWAANPAVDRLASAWATLVLLEARERGFAVPDEMLKAALGYVQELAAADADGLPEARLRALALYVLARGGVAVGPLVAAHAKHLEANHTQQWRHDLAGIYVAAAWALLEQPRRGQPIAAAVQLGGARVPDYDWYYDGLAHDAQTLYLVARHFPQELPRVGAAAITAMADPIFNGRYNTHSSAWAILALEAYGQAAGGQTRGALAIAELAGKAAKPLALAESLVPLAPFSAQATALRFSNRGAIDAYFVVGERGFDLAPPRAAAQSKVEVLREYLDAAGKPLASVAMGEEVRVRVRLRALGAEPIEDIAIVDLLPGGFEPVLQGAGVASESAPAGDEGRGDEHEEDEEDGESAEADEDHEGGGGSFTVPFALAGSTLSLSHADVREDRVVLYATATPEMKELVYLLKATNVGTYAVPAVIAEGLYDRSVVAHGAGAAFAVTPRR